MSKACHLMYRPVRQCRHPIAKRVGLEGLSHDRQTFGNRHHGEVVGRPILEPSRAPLHRHRLAWRLDQLHRATAEPWFVKALEKGLLDDEGTHTGGHAYDFVDTEPQRVEGAFEGS